MASRGRDQEYNQIPRNRMMREIQLVTDLDYGTPHSREAHASAVARRAFVDWNKVAQEIGTQEIGTIDEEIGRQLFHRRGQVRLEELGGIVIVVDNGSLTLRSGELNYRAIWDHVKTRYGDQFDFLTFFADFPVPFGYSFWSPIDFRTQGISPYQPFDIRSDWNTSRLQGFHFINPGHVNLMGVYLQEFGHQWGSFVYFADSPDSAFVSTNLLLGGEPGHWDFYMDDDHSPMNYDFNFTPYMSSHWVHWSNNPPLFDYHAIEGIEYCDLDLYLMGLIPPEAVRPFYFIGNPQQVAPETWTGQRREVTVDMVINAMGTRNPPGGLRENDFRDPWILVTRNRNRGRRTASGLDAIRQDFEWQYHVATRSLGHVDTTLP